MQEHEQPPARRRWRRWKRGESGQGLAEYGMILALIAVVCAGAVGILGQDIVGSVAWTSFAF